MSYKAPRKIFGLRVVTFCLIVSNIITLSFAIFLFVLIGRAV